MTNCPLELPFKVGSRVICDHTQEQGVITHLDLNCYPLYRYGVTTCIVQFADGLSSVLWTNRISLVEA